MAKKPAAAAAQAKTAVAKLLSPVQDFINTESASGVVLIGAALVAFAWANSPWAEHYFAILEIPVGVGFGAWGLEKPLILWVNDLLMATDIAFALGVLTLLGERVNLGLKVFLLALAIVDDLGAVLVIALFYTEDLSIGALLLSFLAWAAALAYGRFGGGKALAFALIGLVTWYFMLKSGVHATIAGVLMALAVPLRHQLSPQQLYQELRPITTRAGDFEQVEAAIEHLEEVLARAHSPLHKMEHALGPFTAFGIMAVFAFFNAGVALGGGV